jgi:hypothetical protein
MLFSGLRSAEVLALTVADVDIARGWARAAGKGGRERRVPVDAQVAGWVQTYLLAERPETTETALFVVAKGRNRRRGLTPAGLRTIFRYHRDRAGVPDGHPHALRHSPCGCSTPASTVWQRLRGRSAPWRVLHSVALLDVDGRSRGDIDHVVVGPPGLVTINTKHHRGGRAELYESMLTVNGRATDYLAKARREAGLAGQLLAGALARHGRQLRSCRLPAANRPVPKRAREAPTLAARSTMVL